MEANTLAEVSRGIIGHSATEAVIYASGPGGHLLAALAQAGQRFVLAADNPRQALLDLVSDQGVIFPEALRRVARSCAALEAARATRGALFLDADAVRQRPSETVSAISRHLDLIPGTPDVENCLSDLGADFGDAKRTLTWEAIDEGDRQIAENALSAYLDPTSRIRGGSSTIWAPEMFCLGGQPDQPVSGPIDITGRARCLFEGPNIHVRPGTWTLSVTLAFSPGAAEHDYVIEIFGGEMVQQHVIRADANGRFEGSANLQVPATAVSPLNIRLSSRRAAFDGSVTLLEARLTSLDVVQ
jgi:hypothetical protein